MLQLFLENLQKRFDNNNRLTQLAEEIKLD